MGTGRIELVTQIQQSDPGFFTQQTQEVDEVDFLDRRGAERAPVVCPVRFSSEERYGDGSNVEGTLCDLSKTGCKIFSLIPPRKGAQITLFLQLPDGMPPLYLIGTTVRHVQGHDFGAEFLPLTPEERRRIQAVIFKFVTWSAYSLRRPAFRIV